MRRGEISRCVQKTLLCKNKCKWLNLRYKRKAWAKVFAQATFIYNGTLTVAPLLVGLRKYYMQHWGSNKTGLKENFYKKQRKCGNKSKAFWTKVWTK
jgi:hypothetical protein